MMSGEEFRRLKAKEAEGKRLIGYVWMREINKEEWEKRRVDDPLDELKEV